MSMKLLHESVRKISAPTPLLPSPALVPPAPLSQSCSTPAYSDHEENPWWLTESFVMDETTSVAHGVTSTMGGQSSAPADNPLPPPSTPQTHSNQQLTLALTNPTPPPTAPQNSSTNQQPNLASLTLPPPPSTPQTSRDFLGAEELIAIRTASSSR